MCKKVNLHLDFAQYCHIFIIMLKVKPCNIYYVIKQPKSDVILWKPLKYKWVLHHLNAEIIKTIFQTVEKVGLPQEKYLNMYRGRRPVSVKRKKENDKGFIENPLSLLVFHQNEPCRTFVLSAFILMKYPFLLSTSVSAPIVYRHAEKILPGNFRTIFWIYLLLTITIFDSSIQSTLQPNDSEINLTGTTNLPFLIVAGTSSVTSLSLT